MILLMAFIMLCCFGLGVAWNIVWVNMRELDAWIERRRREEKEFTEAFKKGVEEIRKELDTKQMVNIGVKK